MQIRRRVPQRPDVIILGPGRSGTSAVARILHQHFDVCFGHHETMFKDFRGEVVYEDQGLKKIIKRVVKREVGIDAWLRKFGTTHKGCTAKLTGAKLLDFAALTISDVIAIGPRLVISTYRPFQSCVDSWVRYRNGGIQNEEQSRQWAEEYVRQRQTNIDYLIRNLKALGFNTRGIEFTPEIWRYTDDELIERIGKWVTACL